MTKEKKQEFAMRVTQANQSELTVIIYDIIFECIEVAQKAIQEEDKGKVKDEISLARQFLNQLMGSLDYQYAISFELMPLYTFVDKKLAEAMFSMDEEALSAAKDIFNTLYKSFQELAKQDVSNSVMQNSETVYAGLTYGKENLSEMVEPGNENRGYRV